MDDISEGCATGLVKACLTVFPGILPSLYDLYWLHETSVQKKSQLSRIE